MALSALSAAWWFFRRKRGINGREKDKGAGFENDKVRSGIGHPELWNTSLINVDC